MEGAIQANGSTLGTRVFSWTCLLLQMDGAILVVSAADGPMPQTREHILLARQVIHHRTFLLGNHVLLLSMLSNFNP